MPSDSINIKGLDEPNSETSRAAERPDTCAIDGAPSTAASLVQLRRLSASARWAILITPSTVFSVLVFFMGTALGSCLVGGLISECSDSLGSDELFTWWSPRWQCGR
jgi:hypothetical protein